MAVVWSDVLEDYVDNAGYTTADGARAFIAAARKLLVAPDEIQSGSERTRFNRSIIPDQIAAAQAFITANDPDAGGVIHSSFEGMER